MKIIISSYLILGVNKRNKNIKSSKKSSLLDLLFLKHYALYTIYKIINMDLGWFFNIGQCWVLASFKDSVFFILFS